MRVHAERRDVTEFEFSKRAKVTRGYALVEEGGKPLFTGLFVTEAKAEDYAKQRGWKFVREAT